MDVSVRLVIRSSNGGICVGHSPFLLHCENLLVIIIHLDIWGYCLYKTNGAIMCRPYVWGPSFWYFRFTIGEGYTT